MRRLWLRRLVVVGWQEGRVDDAAPSECPHLRKRTDSSGLRICEDCRKVNP